MSRTVYVEHGKLQRLHLRASELLLSIPSTKRTTTPPASTFQPSTPAPPRSPRPTHPFNSHTPIPDVDEMGASVAPGYPAKHPQAPPLTSQPPEERAREAQLEAIDEDYIVSARALIDAKEYTRAIHWLRNCKSSKALFLSVYSRYMVSIPLCFLPQTFDDSQIQGQREESIA